MSWTIGTSCGPSCPACAACALKVTSFLDQESLGKRLTDLSGAGFDGIAFVGVPRTMKDGEGEGVAPTDALSIYEDLVPNRGAIPDPHPRRRAGPVQLQVRAGRHLRHDPAAVLRRHRRIPERVRQDHRPPAEILLSFGFVPKLETKIGLINWLIQDPGNPAVAAEQEFVSQLAAIDPAEKRKLMLDLYKRVIDGVAELGFPLSIHFEAAYGVSKPAFETFAEMLEYWAPDRVG